MCCFPLFRETLESKSSNQLLRKADQILAFKHNGTQVSLVEVIANAWIHGRHSKFAFVTADHWPAGEAPVDPLLAHPKHCYVLGLTDAVLRIQPHWLIAQGFGMDDKVFQLPSGKTSRTTTWGSGPSRADWSA
jgi:hypothetical protein